MSGWINGWATRFGYLTVLCRRCGILERINWTNPLLNLFTSIDIVFIFEVVLSLIALIFAYDAIAGERERGTLRLVVTHPVRRGQILLAKYISAMLCLLVPLLISLLLAVILLTTSTVISLSIGDFLRIGGIILSSIVYLSVFYLIGMLISTVTRRTGTALMLAMFVWGFWVLVYPNADSRCDLRRLRLLNHVWYPLTRKLNRYGRHSTESESSSLRMMPFQEKIRILVW